MQSLYKRSGTSPSTLFYPRWSEATLKKECSEATSGANAPRFAPKKECSEATGGTNKTGGGSTPKWATNKIKKLRRKLGDPSRTRRKLGDPSRTIFFNKPKKLIFLKVATATAPRFAPKKECSKG